MRINLSLPKLAVFMAMLWMCHSGAMGQKIVYDFGPEVIDTLKSGIRHYEMLYNKPEKDLKLYAMIMDYNTSNDIGIYLLEYSGIPPCGLTELAGSTERKIKISDSLFIPVLFPADRLSIQMKKDKMGHLPTSGYYLRVSYDHYQEKVVETAPMLF